MFAVGPTVAGNCIVPRARAARALENALHTFGAVLTEARASGAIDVTVASAGWVGVVRTSAAASAQSVEPVQPLVRVGEMQDTHET